MPSSAYEQLTQRGIGGALALLVQVAAVFLFVIERPSAPPRLPRETIFLLPPLPKAAPPLPAPTFSGPQTLQPDRPALPPDTPAPSLAPPSGIAGFGRLLFGCALENYASLAPDDRARCPKPGEGLALQQDPDLMGGNSHVKDNAHWANAMAHRQTLRMLPGGLLFPLVALGAVLDGSIAEPHSAFRDPEQWPDETDPAQFMPRRLDEQERGYEAWRKDHPVK